MALGVSQNSNTELSELRTSKGSLDQRWKVLNERLGALLGLTPKQFQLGMEVQSDRLWVGLNGNSCERVTRNRGGAAYVAPMCALPNDLHAWFGLQEIWDVRTGAKPFVFRELGVTIHFGRIGDPIKPQIMRLEWPGIKDWAGTGLAFQTPGAAYPHWQIDILESTAKQRMAVFTPESEEVVKDFAEETNTSNIIALSSALTLESMHLASAAKWWIPTAPGQMQQHINIPTDLTGLTLWLIESVAYIKQELERCGVRVI